MVIPKGSTSMIFGMVNRETNKISLLIEDEMYLDKLNCAKQIIISKRM